MFSINELVFAISTNDILFHMQREEIHRKPVIEDTASRLAAHLLKQRSFYPLFPPPARETLPPGLRGVGAGLDVPHSRLADIVKGTPDILVMPSMSPTFIKVVENVVVVNPGSASMPRGTGTWVEMAVKPREVKDSEMREGDDVGHELWERARIEVRKI